MSREAINNQIESHLERWRRKMTSPSATNTDLANDAINSIYRLVKKHEPDAIVWVDSPYQIAVLPPLGVTVLDSAQWAELTRSLKTAGTPGSAPWELCWGQGWAKLREEKFDELANQVMGHSRLRAVPDTVRSAAMTQLGVVMRQIAHEGKVTSADSLFVGKRKKVYRKNVLFTPLDLEFTKALIAAHNRVEQAAGMKLTDGNLLTFYTAMGPFLGVWDKRILTHLLPASEVVLGKSVQLSSLKREQILEVKRKCGDLETLSMFFVTWFMNCIVQPVRAQEREFVPNPQPNTQPETPPELAEQIAGWSNNVVNAYTAISGAVANSREQSREANANPNFANLFSTWLPYSAAWLPFALSVRYLDATLLRELEPEIEAWAYLSHAALSYAFTERVCFACRKPLEFQVNNNNRPHNENGPAAAWLDGFKIYAWRGTVIDGDIIENKSSITVYRINEAENAEIRRVLIEIYGEARYLMDAGAQKVHEDETGVLYRLPVPGDEPLTMVKVRNSTPEPDGTYKFYFLRVPPNMQRAKEAVAWTFSLEEREYKPKHQT